MEIEYSDKTLQLGRRSFQEHYGREPDEAELTEYINAFLELGLAVIK